MKHPVGPTAGAHRPRPNKSDQKRPHTAPSTATDNAPRRPRKAVDTAGLSARDVAASALFAVFVENRAFDDAFNKAAETRSLEPRDRAFARLLATTVLRHRGVLRAVVGSFLKRPLPENQGRLEPILLIAAAQLLFLKTPPHAAISLAVDQCQGDSAAGRFDKLANAVLRRVSVEGPAVLATLDPVALNIPTWMFQRWVETYGAETARRIAEASLGEAALDISVVNHAPAWAERLGGVVMPTGSIRVNGEGRIEAMSGYGEGGWWVQDAAAALPARLFPDIAGCEVADLCAAPGGKTAQLAARGAKVTAVDKSPGRLRRLSKNLTRIGLTAQTMVADAAKFEPGFLFDAVLVDAPCTATGTIRRHPDILHLKRPEDVAALADLQRQVLDASSKLVRPGGTLIYCTCSLEPEEGVHMIDAFLAINTGFKRMPVSADELSSDVAQSSDWLLSNGDVRTLPFHMSDALPNPTSGLELPGAPEPSRNGAAPGGCDGFYIARLTRTA